MLSRRLEAGRSALRRLPHLSTYDHRERASSTLVTPLALHGVAVASVTGLDLWGLETVVVRALWGATRLSRAKEHRISPVMHTRYERLLWSARVARQPGVTQGFTQAVWESGGRTPGTGPMGSALHTNATLGWSPREGWWCWDVPGHRPLHFVQEPLRQVEHQVRPTFAAIPRANGGAAPGHLRGLGDGAHGRWLGLPRGAARRLH